MQGLIPVPDQMQINEFLSDIFALGEAPMSPLIHKMQKLSSSIFFHLKYLIFFIVVKYIQHNVYVLSTFRVQFSGIKYMHIVVASITAVCLLAFFIFSKLKLCI